MITIDCPFCDEPLRMEHLAEAVHCERCRVELEFTPEDGSLAQAA